MRGLHLVTAFVAIATLQLSSGGNVYKETGKNVLAKIPSLVPSGSEFLEIIKNKLSGWTYEPAAQVSNKICSLAITGNNTRPNATTDITRMNYVLLTENENVSIPITDSIELWSSPAFNPNWSVVIFVTGFKSDINRTNRAVNAMWDAYRYRGSVNFIVIDTAKYVDQFYGWSAYNTQDLGEGLGQGLKELIEFVPLNKIHLIGHSLGAHIVGVAGNTFKKLTNQTIPRITGLDPANPCFREGETLSGLMRGDAAFVDIIHTNSKVLGTKNAIGDADFYPNGKVSLQPGCYTPKCSHRRAWLLYAQTVYTGHENDLLAYNCNSMSSLKANACRKDPVPMGYATPSTATGNFYLKTNAHSPY